MVVVACLTRMSMMMAVATAVHTATSEALYDTCRIYTTFHKNKYKNFSDYQRFSHFLQCAFDFPWNRVNILFLFICSLFIYVNLIPDSVTFKLAQSKNDKEAIFFTKLGSSGANAAWSLWKLQAVNSRYAVPHQVETMLKLMILLKEKLQLTGFCLIFSYSLNVLF